MSKSIEECFRGALFDDLLNWQLSNDPSCIDTDTVIDILNKYRNYKFQIVDQSADDEVIIEVQVEHLLLFLDFTDNLSLINNRGVHTVQTPYYNSDNKLVSRVCCPKCFLEYYLDLGYDLI